MSRADDADVDGLTVVAGLPVPGVVVGANLGMILVSLLGQSRGNQNKNKSRRVTRRKNL